MDSSTAGAAFNFTQCGVKDISRPLTELEKYPAVKIRISKGFSFANVDTEFEFEEQRARFFQEHETKDDYMEGREGMDLMNVDFKEYMIAFQDPNNLPWYVSHIVFWLASIFLLSWPLRAVNEFRTAHLHYHIHKLFGSNYLDDYQDLLSRVSTMNSTEFEMSIRNNNVIVPSYSEAMLADIQDQRRDYGTIKAQPSKFPRSLTNVTLAARSRRSVTPTVTMNRVKKFKSCSAFSESTDSAANSGTVRHQIQQLLRDKSKLHQKRATRSQFNLSQLSLGNGSVRFNVGTPVTPEDVTVSSSFSCHSMTSRINETLSEALELGEAFTSRIQPREHDLHDVNTCKQAGSKVKGTPLLGAVSRSRSVPEPERRVQDNLDYIPMMPKTDFPTKPETGTPDLSLISNTYPLSLAPVIDADVATTTAVPTTIYSPTTPPAPPDYDQAIKMRRITVSSISRFPSVSTKPPAKLELTRNSLTGEEVLDSEAQGLADSKPSIDSVLDAMPAGSGINKAQTAHSPGSSFTSADISSLGSPRVATTMELEEHQYYTQDFQHVPHQEHQRNRQQATLKMLPKVNTFCVESDDSDKECLHCSHSELHSMKNVHSTDSNIPFSTSQAVSFRNGSVYNSAATLHEQFNLTDAFDEEIHSPNHVRDDRLQQGTESADPACSVQNFCSPTTSGSRMETSV